MENENTQEVQPEINEQEIELTLEDDTSTEEQPEVDFKAEFLKQKAINQRLAKKLKGDGTPVPKQDLPTKTDSDDIRQTVKQLQLAEQKRQFGYEHNLSPEETDSVFKLSPNPTKDILEDPFVKGGLQALRAKKRLAENTPSSSSRSATLNIDHSKDTADDKQKAFDAYRLKKLGR